MNSSSILGRGLRSALFACPATPAGHAVPTSAYASLLPIGNPGGASAPVMAGPGGDVRLVAVGTTPKRPQSRLMTFARLAEFDQTHPGVTRRPPA